MRELRRRSGGRRALCPPPSPAKAGGGLEGLSRSGLVRRHPCAILPCLCREGARLAASAAPTKAKLARAKLATLLDSYVGAAMAAMLSGGSRLQGGGSRLPPLLRRQCWRL